MLCVSIGDTLMQFLHCHIHPRDLFDDEKLYYWVILRKMALGADIIIIWCLQVL